MLGTGTAHLIKFNKNPSDVIPKIHMLEKKLKAFKSNLL
jgi:hypothetical protein